MTTRVLILPAILIALFAVLGCSSPNDPPQATELRLREKTKAELLVGKWKLVKRPRGLPEGFQMTAEYTKDGKVTITTNNPLEDGPEVQIGTYQLDGDKLLRAMGDPANSLHRNVTIESVAEDKLVTSYMSGAERQISEYERIPDK